MRAFAVSPKTGSAPPVVVYGASGHTGQLVANELAWRQCAPLLAGRRAQRLEAAAAALGHRAECVVADAEDASALRRALSRAPVVINCAGPFAVTAPAVAAAAVEVGSHYVDVTAEPPMMRDLFDRYGREAGPVALVPGAGFYFAISDCIVSLLRLEVRSATRVTVAYAVDDWRMTPASRETAERLAEEERLVYHGGELRPVAPDEAIGTFAFPPPVGEQQVLAYHGGEVLTIPRHASVEEVRVLMTTSTFNPATFAEGDIPADKRAGSRFTIVAEVEGPDGSVRGFVRGRDIYGVGAVTAAETALRLVDPEVPTPRGPLAPAEVLSPWRLISLLANRRLLSEVRIPLRAY